LDLKDSFANSGHPVCPSHQMQLSFETPDTSPVMALADVGQSSSSMTYKDEEYLEDEMVVDEQHTLYNDTDYQ
jgi:hypothetical protein